MKTVRTSRTDKDLKVEVNSATNLVVEWEDSFKDCETHQLAATEVLVDDKPFPQRSNAVRATVKADPCLRHKIEVTLEMKQGNICPGQRITQTSTNQGCKLRQFFLLQLPQQRRLEHKRTLLRPPAREVWRTALYEQQQ